MYLTYVAVVFNEDHQYEDICCVSTMMGHASYIASQWYYQTHEDVLVIEVRDNTFGLTSFDKQPPSEDTCYTLRYSTVQPIKKKTVPYPHGLLDTTVVKYSARTNYYYTSREHVFDEFPVVPPLIQIEINYLFKKIGNLYTWTRRQWSQFIEYLTPKSWKRSMLT
jgi:hypothetical protein